MYYIPYALELEFEIRLDRIANPNWRDYARKLLKRMYGKVRFCEQFKQVRDLMGAWAVSDLSTWKIRKGIEALVDCGIWERTKTEITRNGEIRKQWRYIRGNRKEWTPATLYWFAENLAHLAPSELWPHENWEPPVPLALSESNAPVLSTPEASELSTDSLPYATAGDEPPLENKSPGIGGQDKKPEPDPEPDFDVDTMRARTQENLRHFGIGRPKSPLPKKVLVTVPYHLARTKPDLRYKAITLFSKAEYLLSTAFFTGKKDES